MNALIKVYNVKNFVEFVLHFVFGICFLCWTNTNTEDYSCIAALVFYLFIFLLLLFFFRTRFVKEKIVYRKENAAPLTISLYDMCALGAFIFHITSKKKHTCFAFEEAKWVMCVWVWCAFFFLFFCCCCGFCSFYVHLLNNTILYCFTHFLYQTKRLHIADRLAECKISFWCFYSSTFLFVFFFSLSFSFVVFAKHFTFLKASKPKCINWYFSERIKNICREKKEDWTNNEL